MGAEIPGKTSEGIHAISELFAVNSLQKLKIREYVLSRRIWDHVYRVCDFIGYRLIAFMPVHFNGMVANSHTTATENYHRITEFYLLRHIQLQIHFIKVLWPFFLNQHHEGKKYTFSTNVVVFEKNTIAR